MYVNFKPSKIILATALLNFASSSFSFDLKQGHAVVQLGGFISSPGKSQHIDIVDLIGDQFTVTNHQNSNALVGLGYFIDGPVQPAFNLAYGINAFYLGKTSVNGNIIQENLFTNLAYRYDISNLPIYAAAKATIPTKNSRVAATLDAGIGPNFITTRNYRDSPLDNITLPDNAFSEHTQTTFSATAGIGVKINRVFGEHPLECAYRFFYLGQGQLAKNNSQLLNTLNTGNTYANALLCSITV